MVTTITRPEALSDEQLNGLDASQLRSEIKLRYDYAADIEKRYASSEANQDKADEEEVKRLLGTIDRLEDRLSPFEEAEQRRQRIFGNVERYNERAGRGHKHATRYADEEPVGSIGQQLVEAAQYKSLAESGILRNSANRVDLTVPMKGRMLDSKALVWSGTGSGGGLVANDVLPGVRVPILLRQLTVLDLIPRSSTTSDTIEYTLESAFTNAAAPVPEATASSGTSGTKPESTLTYSNVTAPVRTIAHWIPVTNRMLADAPALRGLIDARLIQGLELTLESQIISGDGTGENFLGILNTPGVNVQAKGTNSGVDAIFLGMMQVMVTGLSNPSAIVLNPIDFGNMRLARENSATGTLGGYLMGPPSSVGPVTLWGRPTTISLGLPAGTAVVGDFATSAMLWDREEGQVRVGWINDQFIRNIQTLLAELRAAFGVLRGAAFSKVTGL
jgi:HK97 family phage major capsid protein